MSNASTPLSGNALVQSFDSSQLRASAFLGIVIIGVLLYLSSIIGAKVEPDEPPVLKSTVPFVGHIINMIRNGTMFLPSYRKFNLPVATLPMLNGKMYVIWDTTLVQGLFRKKGFSIEKFAAQFAGNVGNLDTPTRELFHKTPIVRDGIDVFSKYLLKGEGLRKVNMAAIHTIEDRLHEDFGNSDTTGDWLEVPNLYRWLRNTMTVASSRALWGPRNPLAGDPTLLDDFWAFESKILIMALDLFPRITARKAYAGRARVQAVFGAFHEAGFADGDDVSDLIRERAQIIRSYGVASDQIGKMETNVLGVALGNTVPTLFWFFVFIISTPGLAGRIRDELEGLVRRDGDEATLDVSKWEQSRLMMSCYREVMRLTSTVTITRRGDEDTKLVGPDGREYMIRAGVDVQISGIAAHTDPEIWGDHVDEFHPERFLPFFDDPSAQHVREKKAAYYPFGGGRHMCPGRYFAFTEIMTFVAVLPLGYDVQPGEGAKGADGKSWGKPPQRTRGSMAEAISKPIKDGEGYGVRIRRKAGWENVRWHFDI
ncbi:hypothetical protein ACHAQH_008730 [Verticillium albo-atrum]